MKKVLFVLIGAVVIGLRAAAPPLLIEPAVQISFEAKRDLFYQLEMSDDAASENWIVVGPTWHGQGSVVSESIAASLSSTLFFRTQEYDLTNGLFAHYRLNGEFRDAVGRSPSMRTDFSFTTNRFGAAMAAVYLVSVYPDQETALTLQLPPKITDYTISFWGCNPSNTPPARLFTLHGSTNLYLTADAGLKIALGSTANVVLTSQPLVWTAGRWYLFQIVRAGNVYKLYVDGQLLGEATVSGPANMIDYGNISFGPAGGVLDEVRLYSRALSEHELRAVAALEE